MKHEWYHSLQTKEVYHHGGNTISKYFYKRNNHSKVRLNIDSKEKKIPRDATPIIPINNTEFVTQERFTYHPISPPITQKQDNISRTDQYQGRQDYYKQS